MNETTIERNHRLMVIELAKSAEDITANMMNTTTVHMMHAALGIAGEAGEVVDLIKKIVINGKPVDRTELMKELGDLEWYMALLRSVTGIDRQVVLEMNTAKLRERYPGGYSDQASADRVDVETCDHDWVADPAESIDSHTCRKCFDYLPKRNQVDVRTQEAFEYECSHPELKWAGIAGYVCVLCGAPAAAVKEDIA